MLNETVYNSENLNFVGLKMEIFLKHHFQFGYLLSLLQAKLQNSFIITNLKTITELPSSVKQQRS